MSESPASRPADRGTRGPVLDRQYLHSETAQRIDLRLYAARSGSTWQHDPAYLAENRGYRQFTTPRSVSVTTNDISEAFWEIELVGSANRLNVLYAWSDGGAWRAAAHPGIAFPRRDFIYKLEVTEHGLRTEGERERNRDFLEQLLPVVRQHLSEAPALRLPRHRP